ncbi:hypothetical protein ACFQ0B_33870 [Nonomuraea thailandensis]
MLGHDDVSGLPTVEAARLVAVAEGGQVLCTDLVRRLAQGRSRHEFKDLGRLPGKGCASRCTPTSCTGRAPTTTSAAGWLRGWTTRGCCPSSAARRSCGCSTGSWRRPSSAAGWSSWRATPGWARPGWPPRWPGGR